MCEQELLLGLLDRVQFSQNLGNDMFTVLFMVLPNTLNKELYGVCRYGKFDTTPSDKDSSGKVIGARPDKS